LKEQSYRYNARDNIRKILPCAIVLATFASVKNREKTSTRRMLSAQLKVHYADIPELVS
jgi:hypothetical protein